MTQEILFLTAFVKQWEAVDGSPELTTMYKVFCDKTILDGNLSADENLIALQKAYKENENIEFMFIDKTGRGIKNKITLNQILDMDDEQDYYDKWLHEWAIESKEGDEWDDFACSYIRL